MSNMQVTTARTPFWGQTILRTVQGLSVKTNEKEDRERKEKIRELFEMIDDYIEQT